jgi:hypothetical protein
MTDPRIASVPSWLQLESDPKAWAERFDNADAAAGVVRVDTRDPDFAQVERVARALQQLDPRPGFGLSAYSSDARAVLAALTEDN